MATELAIFNGEPVRKEPYPRWPEHDVRDVQAVSKVVESGRWGGYPYPGPQTAEFARRFAEMQGGEYAVCVVNGTITMEVALRAADIGWGDEVIVPAYTFQATAAAPISVGAIPVIVDVDPDTYCIDPKKIAAAITPRTRAIIPVHLGAQMADMDAIMEIAEQHNLVVIEDCAHAHGAKWRGRGAGAIGHFGSFSLQSSKILTTGEGGLLLCRTPALVARATAIIDCGRPHSTKGDHGEVDAFEEGVSFTMGGNYRMTELQSALGNVALDRFPEQVKQREAMIGYIEECLSEIPGVRLLKRDERHTTRSFYRFIFAIDPDVFGADHRVVCDLLDSEGIPCWVGYEAMNRYSLFRPTESKLPVPCAFPEKFQLDKMSFPEAERACEQQAVWLDESIFRAGKQGVEDAVAAIAKIQANAGRMDEIIPILIERSGG
ncbi:MAG TPA: DegT/DnrJ/EryC1/StrS family aminotransferase [Levilinea sp.]|nr:DegT/DnrJ/EryC1/StrS family aminotransferase [Levilinea sp.]